MFVILSDRTLSLSKGKGVEGPASAFAFASALRALYQPSSADLNPPQIAQQQQQRRHLCAVASSIAYLPRQTGEAACLVSPLLLHLPQSRSFVNERSRILAHPAGVCYCSAECGPPGITADLDYFLRIVHGFTCEK